jgi:leucyl aminopeptidase (aminopeptidase T)
MFQIERCSHNFDWNIFCMEQLGENAVIFSVCALKANAKFGTQLCETRRWESVRKMQGKCLERFAERTLLIAAVRTSGHGVVYCLETFVARQPS